jgi:uncharacterized protein YkwD
MALTAPRKRKPNHKKSQGSHHRHSKHYLKTYSPYLPLLLLVIIGLAVNSFWTSRIGVLGAQTSLSAPQLLSDTNTSRIRGNQDPLRLNPKLSAAAQAKANDMAMKNYWSHTTPSGQTPWEFIKQSGYEYYTAGENLAYGFGNSEDTITGWLNSREHRSNMLSQDFTEAGFGISTAKDFQGQKQTTIIVALYAEPAAGLGGVGFTSAAATIQAGTPLRTVSRVQLLTSGQAPWSYFLVLLATFIAAAWFIMRHAKAWHRVVVAGETFIVRHKYLDFLFIATAVAGFVLTRAAGFIH